jgi:hypothetical protein
MLICMLLHIYAHTYVFNQETCDSKIKKIKHNDFNQSKNTSILLAMPKAWVQVLVFVS